MCTYGNTGGEATHTLTVSEMPSHTHIQNSHNHTQNTYNHTVAINAGTTGGTYNNACKTNNYVGSMGAMCGNTTATNCCYCNKPKYWRWWSS